MLFVVAVPQVKKVFRVLKDRLAVLVRMELPVARGLLEPKERKAQQAGLELPARLELKACQVCLATRVMKAQPENLEQRETLA